MWKDSPIVKRLKPCEDGLIGNTRWAWCSQIPALMARLSEFRERLVAGQAETVLLDVLLDWSAASSVGASKPGPTAHRFDARAGTGALTFQPGTGGRNLTCELDEVAGLAPDWLASQVSPEWFERYGHRVENYRLPKANARPWLSTSGRMACICWPRWSEPTRLLGSRR